MRDSLGLPKLTKPLAMGVATIHTAILRRCWRPRPRRRPRPQHRNGDDDAIVMVNCRSRHGGGVTPRVVLVRRSVEVSGEELASASSSSLHYRIPWTTVK